MINEIDEECNNNNNNSEDKFFEIRTRTETTKVNKQNIYIHLDIQKCEHLPLLLNTFRNASKTDQINVFINSTGGCLHTTFSILNAMHDCQAPIVTIADGMVASAATFIFLKGHRQEVREHSIFMAHNFSSYLQGKGHEILEKSLFNKSYYDKFFKSYYLGFFSEEEIEEVIKGKDIYIEKEEIVKRLEARKIFLEQEAEKVK